MKCLCAQSHFTEFERAVKMRPSPDAGLPNTLGRHRELPGKTIPMRTAWPFPKKKKLSCFVAMERKDCCPNIHWLLWKKKTTANSKIIKTRCFSFYCSLDSLYWGGEGKDPESLEDCGGELMLLRWTSNKTRVQKSARERELPWQPKGSIKGQARKQMLEVMATCNKSVKPKTYWASFHHTGKSNR